MVSIDSELKAKCPRVALACVTAEVLAGATPEGLDEELRACEEKILKLPEPKAVLESAAILATRAAYKALGKDPARYRGSAEALLRRVIAGKGLPRINNVVDVINLVSVESRLPVGLMRFGACGGRYFVSSWTCWRNIQRDWKIRFEFGRVAGVLRCAGAAWKSDERFGANDGDGRDEAGSRHYHLVWRRGRA